MRTIKFRAMNKTTNEMEYDLDLYSGNMPFKGVLDNPYDYDGNTLGQYTGIQDRNKKEIYEGDIVTSYATDVIGIVKFGNYMAGGEDYYASGAYGFYVQRLFDGKIISEDDTETLGTHNTVIGNIYQNPELIKNHE